MTHPAEPQNTGWVKKKPDWGRVCRIAQPESERKGAGVNGATPNNKPPCGRAYVRAGFNRQLFAFLKHSWKRKASEN